MKIVVSELDHTKALDYKVALLAFINCMIISAKNLQDRLRIRNELIGKEIQAKCFE
jgi:inverted formin-2